MGGGLDEAVFGLVGVDQGDAEDDAVGGDQRQEDAQHAIKQGAALLHQHLGELHHHGDHQDEADGAQELQVQRPQHVALQQVAAHRRQRQHEGGGERQADGGLDLPRNAHERAQAEELHQHEVVDQDGADQDEGEFGHRSYRRKRTRAMEKGAPIIGKPNRRLKLRVVQAQKQRRRLRGRRRGSGARIS
ncbi:hypothetical protein D9M71_606740 [compost metagenome]